MPNNLDAYNAERNHLSLDDTNDLIKVVDVLEAHYISEPERIRVALMFLDEFIAVRGYDENPVEVSNA